MTFDEMKERLDHRLNDHLCGMKEGYDDSITGFNEAWTIMRALFEDDRQERIARLEDALSRKDDDRTTDDWNLIDQAARDWMRRA